MMLKLAFFSFLTFYFSQLVSAQEKVFHLHAGEKEYNYAQAYRSGNMLYVSGTVGQGDMDKALERVYKTLERTLKEYKIDFTHVVKENLYTTNLDEVIKHRQVRKNYYKEHSPAASWVQVARLFEPDTVVEVELVAEIKKTP